MKRAISDQPEGTGSSVDQWRELTEEQRQAIIQRLTQSAATTAAPRPNKRRILESESDDDGEAPTQAPAKVPAQQQAAGSSSGDVEDDLLADLAETLALKAGDAYIIGHGETVGTVPLPEAMPKQIFCFYAKPDFDLNFVDALRVLSGKNAKTTYTVQAGENTTLPKLSLTPFTEQEKQWVKWSLTAPASVGKRKIFFVGEAPLNNPQLTLFDALGLVKYERVHVIACQGAAGTAATMEKSPEALEVEAHGLQIILSAPDFKPAQTIAFIDGKPLPELAELMSMPFFEFFVDNLKNPLSPTLGLRGAQEFKAAFDAIATDAKDSARLAALLWKALPEQSRGALLHWDKASWKDLAAKAGS
ncbi:hypothetical protein KDL01_24985 [Actinospica durhamensis]|uniref:Uncharacterized protein n=1 Tax=Actinospica durhamensis TaxID=1508375 RepID=A0A941ESU7_9ACTN|nr:hypothetical protein [Actinospica durhamensis]MBR7836558.1 hypothetical protein [Actinospica durhamensis]